MTTATTLEPQPWRPGARVARIRASHSYGFVLPLVIASFLVIAALPDTSWAAAVVVLMQSATLVAAIWTSGLGRPVVPALVLGTIGVIAATTQLLIGGDTLEGAIGLLNVVLVVTIIAVIGLGIVDQREVNRQSVTGAICVYLLLGILFTFLFGAVAHLGTEPFFAQGTDGTPSTRLYFSFVTLATLGYGDYTPAETLGQTLAVTEAITGQLYLVTVVALLVGNLARGRRPRGSEQ